MSTNVKPASYQGYAAPDLTQQKTEKMPAQRQVDYGDYDSEPGSYDSQDSYDSEADLEPQDKMRNAKEFIN